MFTLHHFPNFDVNAYFWVARPEVLRRAWYTFRRTPTPFGVPQGVPPNAERSRGSRLNGDTTVVGFAFLWEPRSLPFMLEESEVPFSYISGALP